MEEGRQAGRRRPWARRPPSLFSFQRALPLSRGRERGVGVTVERAYGIGISGALISAWGLGGRFRLRRATGLTPKRFSCRL